MAIFQDDDAETHAVKAVETALAVQADTESLNLESDDPPLAIHIGDQFRVRRWSARRASRGCAGRAGPSPPPATVTNLAARLAAAAEAGQIIAGPETVRRLANRYQLERLAIDRLKNIAHDVRYTACSGGKLRSSEPGSRV